MSAFVPLLSIPRIGRHVGHHILGSFGTDARGQYIDWFLQPGSSTGADFSGDIIALGEKAKGSGLKVGDVVGGAVYFKNDNGSFQGKLLVVDVITVTEPSLLHRVSRLPS